MTSNTSANVLSQTTGSGAAFSIGGISQKETVRLNSDYINGLNNTNVSYDSLNINATYFGFPKNTSANSSSKILNALSFYDAQIGPIFYIGSVDPGSGYNADMVAKALCSEIYTYGKRDYILTIDSQIRDFTIGETVYSTSNIATVNVIVSSITGNTNFEPNEIIYFSNGSVTAAEGIVYSSNIVAGQGTVVIKSVNNAVSNTNTTQLISAADISNANAVATSVTNSTTEQTAYGVLTNVVIGTSNTFYVQRKSFSYSFENNSTIIGSTSTAQANVVSVEEDTSTFPLGFNASISSQVYTGNGYITNISVLDSGIGYLTDETVALNNATALTPGTAKVFSRYQGKGQGFYLDNESFLSDSKYLFDGNYYQDYSYEIQSALSLETYKDVLKEVVHVLGTKYFGKIKTQSYADATVISKATNADARQVGLTINNVSGFITGELVTQSSSNATGTVLESNSTYVVLEWEAGNFIVNSQVTGNTSTKTANVSSINIRLF